MLERENLTGLYALPLLNTLIEGLLSLEAFVSKSAKLSSLIIKV